MLEHYTPKEELVNKFWETLKNPNLNSEVKITIINLLRELDADWSYETCEEYLGEDYPLYIEDNDIITIDKILKAHYYLKNKNKLSILDY